MSEVPSQSNMLAAFDRGRTVSRVRRALMVLGTAALAMAVASCGDRSSVAAPKHFGPGHASLSIAPTFAPLPAGAPNIVLSKIVGVLLGPNGDSTLVTTTFDGDSAILVFDVQITGNSADFTLMLTAFDQQGIVAYKSTQPVVVKPGNNPGVTAPVLVYAAPDAAIQTLHVTPQSAVIDAGGSASFSVTGAGANGQSIPPLRIAWSTGDPSVATVDGGGGVHAGQFEGSTWLVARAANNVADSAVVSVHAPVDHIVLSPGSLQLIRGTSSSVTAQLLDAGNHVIDDRQATLSSSDPSVATVSDAGVVQGLRVGSATITAAAEGKSATTTVSVVSPVDRIELTPASLSFTAVGKTQTLTAKVVARTGASVDGLVATFASANPFIATVDAAGNVISLSEGSTTITASVDGVSATTAVTVKQVVVSVTVTPATASVTALGDAVSFKATAFDGAGNAIPTATVAWTTDDSHVGAVDSDGRVIAGKAGTATITATSGAVSGSASFTVSQTAKSIKVTSDKSTFMVGQSAVLAASVFDSNGNSIAGSKIEWSTTTATIVGVSADGTVSALGAGTGHLIAAIGDVTASIDVQVSAVPTLDVSTTSVEIGAMHQFSVAGGTAPFTWLVKNVVSGNSIVGTITSAGLYTAPSSIPNPASFDVCATQASPAAVICAHVTVKALSTTTLVLNTSTAALRTGTSTTFAVVSGGNGQYTWSVNDTNGGSEATGTVSSAGLYTAPTTAPASSVSVCAAQANPVGRACVIVAVSAPPTLDVSTLSLLTNSPHTFVASGGSGVFTWSVESIIGGNSTVGSISTTGSYTAPASVPASPTVTVCVNQATPLAQTCAQVTIGKLTLSPSSLTHVAINGHQQFTVAGGTNPYVWTVNGFANGNSTVGTVGVGTSAATYTPPAAIPSSSTFNICVSQTGSSGQACTQLSIEAGVSGRIINASNSAGISGAAITATSGSTVSTSADGSFAIANVDNGSTISITASGFVATQYFVVPVGSTQTALGNIPLAPSSGQNGTITGQVIDASSGHSTPVAGATVTIRSGANNSLSGSIAVVTTDGSGNYSQSSVADGTYTVSATATGFASGSATTAVVGTNSTTQDISIVPNTGLRITLTWGIQPHDLDSHLFGPTSGTARFHVWYDGRTGPDGEKLDQDITGGEGPENTTVPSPIAGEYRFYVQHYAGSSNMDASGATVRVTLDGTVIGEFHPPARANERDGDIWEVFTFDGTTITALNTVVSGSAGSVPESNLAPTSRTGFGATQNDVQAILTGARQHPKGP